MSNGASGIHSQLCEALKNYIKTQYFGKSPILFSAIQGKLDREGVLYQKPYIESSPAYQTAPDGILKSPRLPGWLKDYFKALSDAKLLLKVRIYLCLQARVLVRRNALCGL